MSLVKIVKKELSLEEKQAQFKDLVVENVTTGFNGVATIQYNLHQQIWFNDSGLSPQECFDALGEDAVPLLTAAELVGKMLLALNADHVSPAAPNEIEVDKEGKVTVGKVKDGKALDNQ